MDNIYSLIKRLSLNRFLTENEIISRNNLSYTQSFNFTLTENVYYEYEEEFKLYPDQIAVNGYKINQYPDIDSRNNVQISVTASYFKDDLTGFNEFIFYNDINFKKFSEFFFNEIKISHLGKIKEKAKVEFLFENDIKFENSIFSEAECADELFVPEVLLNDEYYLSIKAISLPGMVPDLLLESLLNRKIESQFELLSNHFVNNETYIINSDKTVSFNTKEIDYSSELTKDLEKIIRFIFEDERHYYDKLEIFKNIFSLNLLKMGRVGKKLSAAVLDDIKSQYSLYMSDNLDEFIKDKQLITEKYISSYRVLPQKLKQFPMKYKNRY